MWCAHAIIESTASITSSGHDFILNQMSESLQPLSVCVCVCVCVRARACVCARADEKVALDLSRTLQQARINKGWNQKDLATVSSSDIVQHVL